MQINPQIIKKNNVNEFVVLPYNEYLEILEMAEDYEDLMKLRGAKELPENKENGKPAKEILNDLLINQ